MHRGLACSVMRRLMCGVVALGATLAVAGPARAASLPAEFHGACPEYGSVEICSGSVPSFDGAKLDVDVTRPLSGGRHPLIVMLHGFGNNKHEWESLTDQGDGADKWHWNSHWFAEHGYYVLTYTARGFRADAPTAGYQPPTPPPPGDNSGSVDAP